MLNTCLYLVVMLIIHGAVPPILSIFLVYSFLKHLNLTNLTNLFYESSSHKNKHVWFMKFNFLKYTGWRTKCHTIDCALNAFLLLQKHLTSGTELIL